MFCTRCGKPYTAEDREKSRFCEECGTYRPRRPTRSGLHRSSNSGSYRSHFPYRPYPQQNEFMRDVYEIVGRGGVLIAEACNGFGKTACSLAATLPTGRRILYATRTHEQALQVMREIQKINVNSEREYTAVNLASRSNLCLHKIGRELRSSDLIEGCRILRERNRCPYKWGEIDPALALPRILSIRRLREFGFSRGICPYFLARNLINERDVVVGPYQYFFDQMIRNRVGLTLREKILIFDEAHNSDKIGIEVLSGSLSRRTLEQAEEELQNLKRPAGFLRILMDYLEEKSVDGCPRVEVGGNVVEELSERLGISDIDSFTEPFTRLIDEIRVRKMERGRGARSYLSGVIQFLRLVFSKPSESYVGVFSKAGLESERLDYRCLDASLAIRPVVEGAFGTLIMSGTLTPIEFFAEMIGLSSAVKRNYETIANPERITAYLDSTVTTRFEERKPAMLLKYGLRIEKFLAEKPAGNGNLIFFPQRKLMMEALKYWEEAGLVKRSGKTLFFRDRELFVEGVRAGENRRIVERYKEKASRAPAILLGVYRGRNAEGSNFPDEEARTIFLVGVPYADYADPVVRAQIDYFNRKSEGLGERWYIAEAFRAANQAAGRGIRHREDWCRFVFMDSRYRGCEKLVPPWISARGFKELP